MGHPASTAAGDRVSTTDLLVLGAGPFGIAMAAHAKAQGRDFVLLGRTMESWTRHMPAGMFLRSGCDWHLDTARVHTIERFAGLQGKTSSEALPLSGRFYLDYVRWFMEQKGLVPDGTHVARLDHQLSAAHRFRATLEDGRVIRAGCVVLALGFAYSEYLPSELTARLPPGRHLHTWNFVDFAGVEGQRILIVGGRQSAFEWAALVREAGAASVDVAYRSPTPDFAASDWSWVDPLVAGMVGDPGWFRGLSQEVKDQVSRRFWAEGRLKLEPWLKERVLRDGITLRPGINVMSSFVRKDGAVSVRLDDGTTLTVDQVVLATGYRPRLDQVPFLASGNVLAGLSLQNGCTALDESFQTALPGLFLTSFAAAQDFGPFFAFTVSARASAEVIGRALAHRVAEAGPAPSEHQHESPVGRIEAGDALEE